MKTRIRPHSIGIVSLGCAKNLVDTEVLMKQLDENKFRLVWDPQNTDGIDTAIINTCGFILDAKNESVDTILRFAGERKKGNLRHLFVMGCLSERYREELRNEIPEVDEFFGVNELGRIVKRVGGTFRENLVGERYLTTPRHFAYLKIAEGCDRKCSFCAIPLIRGKHVSVPLAELVKQSRSLAGQGVRELIIISQDTTWYGKDLYKKRELGELLLSVSEIKELEWIRLHYAYPDGFPLEILDIINERPNICNYLDIPLQHISERILRSMKRGISAGETKKLIDRIRKKIPGVAIRTTFMVGYPGETESEFNELREFVAQSKFDRVGVFTYSHEEDTDAFGLRDSIPEEIKKQRAGELMEIQQDISMELNNARIGTTMKVIIDREENGLFIGRTEYDSPEIDNEVIMESVPDQIRVGNFYPVVIRRAESFDLFGEIDPVQHHPS